MDKELSEDAQYIYSLLVDWVKEQPEGLAPMFYGTLTRDGDVKVKEKVMRILKGIGQTTEGKQ